MASFVETVELAQQAGATINITYQTATNAKSQPDKYMGEFAAVLDDLVRTRGFTNVRWVTIQNEPNTTLVTQAQYNALYRALHAQLVDARSPGSDRPDGRRSRREQLGGRLEPPVLVPVHGPEHERHPRRVLGAHLLELLGHPEDGVPVEERAPDRDRGAARRGAQARLRDGVRRPRDPEHHRAARDSAGLLAGRHPARADEHRRASSSCCSTSSRRSSDTRAPSSGTPTGAATRPATARCTT